MNFGRLLVAASRHLLIQRLKIERRRQLLTRRIVLGIESYLLAPLALQTSIVYVVAGSIGVVLNLERFFGLIIGLPYGF